MTLKQTINKLTDLLEQITVDLEKADLKENKAAAQRVRTGTVRLEKIAKVYRLESIEEQKKRPQRKRKQETA